MPISLPPHVLQRLDRAQIIWFVSVRPNDSPHMVPIWFVVDRERVYIVTEARAVKVRNIEENSRVSIALEDGSNPLVLEGHARRVTQIPTGVIEGFRAKYEWEFEADEMDSAVIEFVPERVLLGA